MNFKKTKIVCTLGPSSSSYETIKEMARSGMDVVRLNFSHGDHEEKRKQIKIVREVSQKLNKPIAIIADLQGPKLRLGEIDGILEIEKGRILLFSSRPQKNEIPIQFDLSSYIKRGQRIFLNDGLVELKILEVDGKTIRGLAQNSGWISSRKGVNIPDTDLGEASFTQKDYIDTQFALKEKVDYLALSFARRADDVEVPKKLITESNAQIKIIVKIEKREAIENLEEIIHVSDAVIIARGDLAIETSAAEVPVMQQKIIAVARQHQKPVIVATQMLESMTQNPRPTRAEASDIGSAVLNEVDALMLSAESASGKYPVAAVQTMNDIIISVEENPDYKRYIKINWENIPHDELQSNAITSSAASLAFKLKSPLIGVTTASGQTVRFISSFRPAAKLISITYDYQIWNQLSLVWGVYPILAAPKRNIVDTIKVNKLAKKGDKIVLVGGSIADSNGFTNTIKVVGL